MNKPAIVVKKKHLKATRKRKAQAKKMQEFYKKMTSREREVEEDSNGIGFLGYIMEEVVPEDVESKGVRWVGSKYSLIAGLILGNYFSDEVFDDPSALLGRYTVEMGKVLRKYGIDFVTLRGITEKGIERINAISPI